jgi:hypothetical protein
MSKRKNKPRCSNEQYLDGLKLLVLSKRNPQPALINAVSDSIDKVIGAACKMITTRADARVAAAQEQAYKEGK